MYKEDISTSELEEFYKKISKQVKMLRKEQGITQLELALSIGHKSVSTIGKIEASLENKHYSLEQLYRISKVLKIDIKTFFDK